MKILTTDFHDRNELVEHVKALAPWAIGSESPIRGGYSQALTRLEAIDPIGYAKSRNFANGKVTHLSPYIHHGLVDLNQIRNYALTKCTNIQHITKFIQELAWRDFWQRVANCHPDWVWHDVEPYKTGYSTDDYQDTLPEDIKLGKTGIACIDAFINDLINIGYVHNHARMYLASYVVHFRRIKWQAGASWFLEHLLDGDEASNNFSWQWVASTFSNKPYIFNLENVHKYFANHVDATSEKNGVLDASYNDLVTQLFPMKDKGNE